MTARTFTFTVTTPSGNLPSWVPTTLYQWTTIPGSNLFASGVGWSGTNPGGGTGTRSVIEADCGMCVSASGDLYLFGGGHADYGGNEVYRIQLNANTATCQRLTNPTIPTQADITSGANNSYYLDGKPRSRHSYSALAFDDVGGRLLSFGVRTNYPFALDGLPCDAFYPTATSGTWSARADQAWNGTGNPPMPMFTSTGSLQLPAATVEDRTTGNVWMHLTDNYNPRLWKYTRSTNTLALIASSAVHQDVSYDSVALDTTRQRLYRLGLVESNLTPDPLRYWDLTTNPPTFIDPALTGAAAAEFDGQAIYSTATYSPGMDAVLKLSVQTSTLVYKLNCATFDCTQLITTGTQPPLPTSGCWITSHNHMHKKFVYVPSLKGCVYLPQWNSLVYYLRTDP